MNYAKAILAGNLGRQPELRFLQDGTPVTSFSVAVTDPPRQGAPETSTWWRVSVFGRQAETCYQSLQKGARVLVEGRPVLREYTDGEGSRRCALELRATEVRFLDPRPSSEPPDAPVSAVALEETDDAVPF